MKKSVIPLALLAMALLFAGAFVWDCVRYAKAAQQRVMLADADRHKQEQRLIKLLGDSPKTTADVQSALATYKAAGNARDEAFGQVVTAFRKSIAPQLDATNPLDRALMDDVSGAINRRKIAQKQHDEESHDRERFMASLRGRIAHTFSSDVRDSHQKSASAEDSGQ
jgi:hypothetical protein